MVECPRCNTKYDDPPAFCGACGTKMPGQVPMAAPVADPLIGMIIDGRYRIIDLIGRGGMGAVYQVEHVKIGKIMAMKILHGELSQDPNITRRFKREAETVSRLNHINTVSVFDFGSHKGMMYLLMEYIDGRDLAEILRIEGPLPFTRVAKILIQVCSSLVEAHLKQIVHRDLKPENIIVTNQTESTDFVKVLDFGLAKLRDTEGRTRITAQGSLLGTPYYMAPEHIKGETVDRRSDLYALGAVMHKLLTGDTPFSAATPMGIITKHLTEQPKRPSERYPKLKIPETADNIILTAMSKNPDDRFQSAEAMRRALADALEGITPGSDYQRFSSLGDPSWHGGEIPQISDDDWKLRASTDSLETKKTAAKLTTVKITDAPWAGNLGSSATMGVREVEIGTRSDFILYEKQIKRRRIWTVGLTVALAAIVLVALVYYTLFVSRDDSDPTAETEPNDSPDRADPLTPEVQLAGYIISTGRETDIDWYRLAGPRAGAWGVEVQVTGVPSLDTALQLVDPQKSEPLAIANSKGAGGAERIGPLVVDKPHVYLMVQEVRPRGVPPGSFPQTPYRLLYRVIDASTIEKEPNDQRSSATAAQLGVPVSGVLGSQEDVDWYCLPAGQPAAAVRVTGAPNRDLTLILKLGADPAETVIDNLAAGQGEVASVPQSTGPTCVAVQSKPPAASKAKAVATDALYQILFQ